MSMYTIWTLWRICLLSVYIYAANNVNVTITSSPKLGVGILCQNQNVTLTCDTNPQPAGVKFTWLCSTCNQSEQGDTITVAAELTKVVYTCIVSDHDGYDIGQASVTVIANGSKPLVTRENFRCHITIKEGSNINLTAAVTTDLPLSSRCPIVWKVLHGLLPSNAKVENYTNDGVIYSNLLLHNLTYYENSGNYTCTAKNECGTSLVFTMIKVIKAPIVCKDSVDVAVPLHDVTLVVEGDFIQISCLFKGNLASLRMSLKSYWKVIPLPVQQLNVSYITDNSTYPYHIAVYQTCLTSDGSCCNFTNQLTIQNIFLTLDKNTLTCMEEFSNFSRESEVHASSTIIKVLVIPRIVRGPIQLLHQSKMMLQCIFNASALQNITIVVWKKNNRQLFNSSFYNIIQSTNPDDQVQVVSTLTINSSDYIGTYTCYCYYNSHLVTSSKCFDSQHNSLTLDSDQDKNKHGLPKDDRIGIVVGSVVLVVIIIMMVLCYIFIRKRRRRRFSESLSPPHGNTKEMTNPQDSSIPERLTVSQSHGDQCSTSSTRTAENTSTSADHVSLAVGSEVSQSPKLDGSTITKTSEPTSVKQPAGVSEQYQDSYRSVAPDEALLCNTKTTYGYGTIKDNNDYESSKQNQAGIGYSINSGNGPYGQTPHNPEKKLSFNVSSTWSDTGPSGDHGSEVLHLSTADEDVKSISGTAPKELQTPKPTKGTESVIPITASGTEKPELSEFCRSVAPKYAARWEDLGRLLTIPQYHLDTIAADNKNTKEFSSCCCKAMFTKWINTTPDATWNMLQKAIDDLTK